MQKFWMILGSGTPTYRHQEFRSAKEEAERLARNNPGVEFTVLESVAHVVRSDMVWTKHDRDDSWVNDIPF